jgi:hypothetical protein
MHRVFARALVGPRDQRANHQHRAENCRNHRRQAGAVGQDVARDAKNDQDQAEQSRCAGHVVILLV